MTPTAWAVLIFVLACCLYLLALVLLWHPKGGRHRAPRKIKLRRPGGDRLGDYAYEDPSEWVGSLREQDVSDAEAEQWLEYRKALVERYEQRTSESRTVSVDGEQRRMPRVQWDPTVPLEVPPEVVDRIAERTTAADREDC